MSETCKPTAMPLDEIAQRIHLIRGKRVILDADLAAFYGETTKRFNQQVTPNAGRFPVDFMFQLDNEESVSLRLQIATSNNGRGGRRYIPRVFTEHGAIMAATLLNSPRAIEISVHVVRAFVELRALVATNRELSNKLFQLDRKVSQHDKSIAELIDSMQKILSPAGPPKRPIGFGILDPFPKLKAKLAKK
jgi:ORF6N domain